MLQHYSVSVPSSPESISPKLIGRSHVVIRWITMRTAAWHHHHQKRGMHRSKDPHGRRHVCACQCLQHTIVTVGEAELSTSDNIEFREREMSHDSWACRINESNSVADGPILFLLLLNALSPPPSLSRVTFNIRLLSYATLSYFLTSSPWCARVVSARVLKCPLG